MHGVASEELPASRYRPTEAKQQRSKSTLEKKRRSLEPMQGSVVSSTSRIEETRPKMRKR